MKDNGQPGGIPGVASSTADMRSLSKNFSLLAVLGKHDQSIWLCPVPASCPVLWRACTHGPCRKASTAACLHANLLQHHVSPMLAP